MKKIIWCAILCAGCFFLYSCKKPDEKPSASVAPSSSHSQNLGTEESSLSTTASSSKITIADYDDLNIASESSPFNPYVQLILPPEPLVAITDIQLLMGDWHYYIDPGLTNVYLPTYQVRIEEKIITLGFGTLNSDSAVFYQGKYEYRNNKICATVFLSGDVSSTDMLELEISAMYNLSDVDYIALNISPQTETTSFNKNFSPVLNDNIPFIRYG